MLHYLKIVAQTETRMNTYPFYAVKIELFPCSQNRAAKACGLRAERCGGDLLADELRRILLCAP